MKLFVSTDQSTNLVSFDIDDSLKLGIPLFQISLSHKNVPLLQTEKTLIESGIKEGDVLLVKTATLSQQQIEAESFRQLLLSNPNISKQLSDSNPELVSLASSNPVEFCSQVVLLKQRERQMAAEKSREIALLNADPFNVQAQRKIEEIIRMENVMQNMEAAMENHPESFGQVQMLNVEAQVNGHHVQAFIDSGAQSTISLIYINKVSISCAERCGIMRLVDKRFAGTAKGVGTAAIVGRVHSAPLKLGSHFFPCSFTILEQDDVDFIFGLDMLKRHQVTINLKENCLEIQNECIKFLSEHEISQFAHQKTKKLDEKNSISIENYPKELIESLMQATGNSLSEKRIIELLDSCNGNGDMVLSLLLEE